MKALFFDADGVLYYRQHKRQHLRSFLEQHGFLLPEAEMLRRATRDAYLQASCGMIENALSPLTKLLLWVTAPVIWQELKPSGWLLWLFMPIPT